MDNKRVIKLSKFLSLVLRHQPDAIGIEMDENGWTDVKPLLDKMCAKGKTIDFKTLEVVVDTNNKKRFSFNENKTKIRANQGHSIDVDLGFTAKHPPEILYHGTASKYLSNIYKEGLQKQKRHHVHLSKDLQTAHSVGKRHGALVVFEVNAKEMSEKGYTFYESENGVWLTDSVPVQFLKQIEG